MGGGRIGATTIRKVCSNTARGVANEPASFSPPPPNNKRTGADSGQCEEERGMYKYNGTCMASSAAFTPFMRMIMMMLGRELKARLASVLQAVRRTQSHTNKHAGAQTGGHQHTLHRRGG
jgi:hypothetical protein